MQERSEQHSDPAGIGPERYEVEWLVAGYAANQPDGNEIWAEIVVRMIHEIELYLALAQPERHWEYR
jgi:hypothetical protein